MPPRRQPPGNTRVAATYEDPRSLKPWAKNPRKNDADQGSKAVEKVKVSIQTFGFGAPLVCRAANRMVIAGHTRLKAALELGLPEVPVRWLDLDEKQAEALALADNRIGEEASWDDKALHEILEELGKEMAAVTGFDPDDLKRLEAYAQFGAGRGGGDEAPEAAPETERPSSREGKVYQLGPHRVVCGDSLERETHLELMQGASARLLVTDPPYGISYDPAARPSGGGSRLGTIQNDDLRDEGLTEFLIAAYERADEQLDGGSPIYVFLPAGAEARSFWAAWFRCEAAWKFQAELIWAKPNFNPSGWDYKPQHESIHYGWKPGGSHPWKGGARLGSVLEFSREDVRSYQHPTQKPVDLVSFLVKNSSKEGDLVLDLFGGSGTTLVAAAREGRVARLVEKDPRFVDVIRKRWGEMARGAGIDPGPDAL